MINKIKKIIITGGCGFIGINLIFYLRNSVKYDGEIIVIDKYFNKFSEILFSDLKIKLIILDLASPKFPKLDKVFSNYAIFHLAANSDISKGVTDPNLDFANSTLATFNLLSEILKYEKPLYFIYFSGSGVYGESSHDYPDENFGPLLPISHYGAGKLSAESLVSAFSDLHSFRSCIFRFANIVGPNLSHGVIFDFIKKLKNDRNTLSILGNGTQTKPYVDVDDVISGVFLALNSNKEKNKTEVYNLSNIDNCSVLEIAKVIIKEMKLQNVNFKLTKDNIGWPGDINFVGLNDNKLRNLGWKNNYNSIESIKKAVKYNLKENFFMNDNL